MDDFEPKIAKMQPGETIEFPDENGNLIFGEITAVNVETLKLVVFAPNAGGYFVLEMADAIIEDTER